MTPALDGRRRLAVAGAALLVVALGVAAVATGSAGLPGLGDPAPSAASASFESGNLTLPAKDGAVVRASTTLDPGTAVSVRLRSSGEQAFLKTQTATVAANGSVTATFDVSGVAVGVEATASLHADSAKLASAPVRVVAPDEGTRIAFVGDSLTVRQATGQVIRGTTAKPAGTELLVRVQSSGGNPFLKSGTATVRENGTFRATFDFSGVPDGTTFTVRVLAKNGTELATAEGVVSASN